MKPVKPLEFGARVTRLLQRRSGSAKAPQVEFGNWSFDRSSTSLQLARKAGPKRIVLTEREYRLALALFQHLGSTLSRSHLLEYSGASGEEMRSRALDSHMYRLRNKLFRQPEHGLRLKTIYGQGYRLERLAGADGRLQ
ncbi:winged helix-turn-helix domain-containing protein [Xylophilus rhododendri]|uniref:winged helix-turn-helix domain-containing protein n=1 Tax=Xylophilus rhododendri TaxID=2697032 RepID=UPI001E456212|nr:winged helix-turn-helix domain-containing protein [Xylophilus rhododendri]